MGDTNCAHELNRQLQGLQARVTQAERTATAQYMAMSAGFTLAMTEVTALAPLVAAVTNGTPAGLLAMLGMPSIINISGLSIDDLFKMAGTQMMTQVVTNLANNLIASMATEVTAGLTQALADYLAGGGHVTDPAAIALQNAIDSSLSFFTSQGNLTACVTASSVLSRG